MLRIGMLNNMSLPAIPATERQFTRILTLAGQNTPFELRWFRLVGPRPAHYGSAEELWDTDLDGLIVTGVEPKAAVLSDEPFWPALTRTIEWSKRHTASVIWSCLAAHAAVLYLDHIERQSQAAKIFGLFDSVKMTEHWLLKSVQQAWRAPHSRWNDLSVDELIAKNYTMLAKSAEAGADIFCKRFVNSLFVFIQSHLEYDPHTLLREYNRDVARFASRHMVSAPNLPKNYFDRAFARQLQEMAVVDQRVWDNLTLSNEWEPVAVEFYSNWLGYLAITQGQALDTVQA